MGGTEHRKEEEEEEDVTNNYLSATNLLIYAFLSVICWNNLLKLSRMSYAKLNPKTM